MATTDTYFQLNDSYQLIGAGPCLITIEEGTLALAHVAGSAPSDTDAGHTFGVAPGVEGALSYSGTENVYVRIHPKNRSQPTKVAYTEVA